MSAASPTAGHTLFVLECAGALPGCSERLQPVNCEDLSAAPLLKLMPLSSETPATPFCSACSLLIDGLTFCRTGSDSTNFFPLLFWCLGFHAHMAIPTAVCSCYVPVRNVDLVWFVIGSLLCFQVCNRHNSERADLQPLKTTGSTKFHSVQGFKSSIQTQQLALCSP